MEYIIKNSWLVIGIFMFFISLIGNSKNTRLLTIILFVLFLIIASCRGLDFNDDTKNYVLHFTSLMKSDFSFFNIFSWGWEIGYNAIVLFLTFIFSSKFLILFFITILPGLVFTIVFYKYKYHPSIIFFVYSSIILVATTTTIRHWWALSISFVILNHVIIDNKKSIKEYFYPILFHYSAISLSIILLMNHKERIKIKYITILIIILFSIVILKKDLIFMLYNHFIDRLVGGGIRIFGFRNILNLILIFLIFFSLKKMTINLNRIDFLLFSSMIMSILLMPFYGINRITSFFTLIIIVYINKYQWTHKVNITSLVISLINCLNLIYFYENIKIST